MSSEKPRSRICLFLAVLAIGWSVFAFGSVQDIVKDGAVVITEDDVIFEPDEVFPVRTIAIGLTALAALGCLLLLPAPRKWVRVPRLLLAGGGVLMLLGWFMVVNAATNYDDESEIFVAVERMINWEWAPRSVARGTSVAAMVELSVVLLALCAAIRASAGSAWRGLFGLIAIAGGAVALVGLFHKAAHAPSIYWLPDESQPVHSFFAPYVYNANAGAFMNLCLPLAMGLALAGAGSEKTRSRSIFWAMVAVLLAAGVVVTASKGAIIILLLTVPAYLLWNRRRLRQVLSLFRVQKGRRVEKVALVGVLAAMMLALVAIGITYVIQRWESFLGRFEDPAETDVTRRGKIVGLMLRMIRWDEGGWHGFGSGTFRHLVPYFNVDGGDELDGVWLFGHCDPLQTVVEWGWLGAGAWFLIGVGAVVSGGVLLRRRHGLSGGNDVPLVRAATLSLLMVGLHSCQDFPLSIYSIHLVAILLCGVLWGLWSNRRPAAGSHGTSAGGGGSAQGALSARRREESSLS